MCPESLVESNTKKYGNSCNLAVAGSNTAIWDWSIEDNKISISPNWWTIIGVKSQKRSIEFEEWFKYIHKADSLVVREKINDFLNTNTSCYEFEFRYLHQNGDSIWILSKGQIIRNSKDKPVRVIGLVFDISYQKKLSKKTDFMAYYDELTLLPNRINLKQLIIQSISRISRNSNYGFSLLFLDLDGFKHVNDSFGHSSGDKVLIMVANRFKECIRSIDTVSRVGGDEFVILLDGITKHRSINVIAERIVKTISRGFNIGHYTIYISVSIGIETNITKDSTVDDIIQNADRAMYHAKNEGKGRYYYFDNTFFNKEQHRWFLGNELHNALARNELELYYQPIFNVSTGKIYSFEALLRWNHPEKGLILPSEFIPVAEETGIILLLTEWVLKSVCEKINSLVKNSSSAYAEINFAINISAMDLVMREDFSQAIKHIIQGSGCPFSRITIEVTEGAIIRSYEKAIKQLEELRKLGISIDLDDFGTGYSSLSYISSFPLDIIKIDKSFVDEMLVNSMNLKLIKAIINLAHDLDLKVIAEGVEKSEQLNELYSLGCDYIQGYLYSLPIPSGDIENYLKKLPQKQM